jgi:hypothetical protein
MTDANNQAVRQGRNGRRIRMRRGRGRPTPEGRRLAARKALGKDVGGWSASAGGGAGARSGKAKALVALDRVSVKPMTNEAVNFWTNQAGINSQ